MRSSLCLAAAAVAALASPARAQTSDFTITVPVNVSGLPSNVTEMMIDCYVMPADLSNMTNEIAHGVRRFTVSGAYHSNVVISFNALPGKDPNLARFYSCTAQFFGTDRGVTVAYFPNGQNVAPNFPLAAGAAFNLGYSASGGWVRIPGR